MRPQESQTPRWMLATAAALVLLAAAGLRADGIPDIRVDGLVLDKCWDEAGPSGDSFGRGYAVRLTTETSPIPGLGVSGWAFGVAAEGVSITEFSVPEDSIPEDAFEMTRFAEDVGPCAGRSAVLSAVALSPSNGTTLPVPDFRPLLFFSTVGRFPEGSDVTGVRLDFVDGCRAEGIGVVDNGVLWNGQTLRPPLERCEYRAFAPLCPHPEAALQVIFQSENVGQSDELFAGQAPTADPTGPAELAVEAGATSVWAGIVSQFHDGRGVQGWAFSIAYEGEALLTAATVDGTAADEASRHPNGLRDVGFNKTQVIDPQRFDQGQGVVSAIVLSFQNPVTLASHGTATVLRVDLSGEEGDTARLRWKDGLMGAGTPIRTLATVQGSSVPFTCCQELIVRFGPRNRFFRRGDSNNDGTVDIADAINTLGTLFLGTGVIPPPGKTDCGPDPTEDALGCRTQPQDCR